MGIGVHVSSCNTTGFSSIQTTGSLPESGLSYNPSTSSMRAMYSSSNFATHHIFFPPRLHIVAFEQHSYGLPPYAWNQLAPDRLFGQKPYGPACPSLRRRRAGHRDDALPLFLIQRRSLARTSAIEQRTIQALARDLESSTTARLLLGEAAIESPGTPRNCVAAESDRKSPRLN